jgi:hypothetical protein
MTHPSAKSQDRRLSAALACSLRSHLSAMGLVFSFERGLGG